MQTIVRGNQMIHTCPPVGDRTWTLEDKETAKTLEARWIAKGVSSFEREQLLACAIWKRKLPGLMYTDMIEKRIQELQKI
jgi:hypothetical protein